MSTEIIIAVLKNEDWLSRGVKNVIGLPRPVPYEIDLQNDPAFVERVTGWGYDPVIASSIAVKLAYMALFLAVLAALGGKQDLGVHTEMFTDGLIDRFGDQRVLDTPLAETGIVGMSIGMSVYGLKPVCEIQFSGFSYQNFHQMENHAARLRWRSQGRFHVPMVLRAPFGGGIHAPEHHS